MFRTLPDLHELAEDLGLAWWTAGTLAADAELRDATAARLVTLDARGVNGYRGDLEEASRDLAAHVADGWRLVVVTEGHGPAQHLAQVLTKADVPARLVDSLDAAARAGRRPRHVRRRPARLRQRAAARRPAHRGRPGRAAHVHQGHAQDAVQAAPGRRPAHPQARRPRRARDARHRPLRRDDAARRPGRDPGVPGPGVRAEQAQPARRPGLRPHRRPGPGEPLRRRRGPGAVEDGRLGLGQGQGPRPQGGQADRRRAHPAVQRPDGQRRARLRPGHRLAARARGRLPLRRDAGPAREHRRGQGRHGEGRPDGPPHLRRRRLRQDRDRPARGVQGRHGRQAGRGPRADHAAGPAAPVDLLRALRRLPGRGPGAVPVLHRRRGEERPRGRGRRQRRRRHRHAPPAEQGHALLTTSASSSSTRSSASASSTRSS